MAEASIHLKYTEGKCDLSCAIFNKITCCLPQRTINTDLLKISADIILTGPIPFTPSTIDLSLGTDVYYDII